MGDRNLAWKIMFGEEPEHIPDQNKPENQAWFNAQKARRHKDFHILFSGPGRPLMELWQKQLRNMMMDIITIPDTELCTCRACEIARRMNYTLNTWLDAETILAEKPKET